MCRLYLDILPKKWSPVQPKEDSKYDPTLDKIKIPNFHKPLQQAKLSSHTFGALNKLRKWLIKVKKAHFKRLKADETVETDVPKSVF